ncbi:MAG: response regulator [Planctomycetes bacterium]|nr:response regulator [Planctomycetota bacterium]
MIPERVLCVDDDLNLLAGLARNLRKHFNLLTAGGGEQGLEVLRKQSPVGVVVADMNMPGMDGVEFLRRVAEQWPDATRVMLTGNADQATAVKAINTGQIFRFLVKPCPPELLAATIAAGIKQHRLVTAERELLEKTFQGGLKLLFDMLALARPEAFGRGSKLQRMVRDLAPAAGITVLWQAEAAAMLAQLGWVAVPAGVLTKVEKGQPLSTAENEVYEGRLHAAAELVGNVPRLEAVHQILLVLGGGKLPEGSALDDNQQRCVQLLRALLDLDGMVFTGMDPAEAMAILNSRTDRYTPEVLAGLNASLQRAERFAVKSLDVWDLREGMTLMEDVSTKEGQLLLPKGQEVTAAVITRLKNYSRVGTVREPFMVKVPG